MIMDMKKKYFKPTFDVLNIESMSMICTSAIPERNNPLRMTEFKDEGETDGGGEEWDYNPAAVPSS